MDRFLDQLSVHPLTALLAGAILLASILLMIFKRTERSTLLPSLLGLALLAWACGIAFSVLAVVNLFRAIALTGSGGRGGMAAGLAEALWSLLIELAPALLILLMSLLFARDTALSGPEAGAPRRLMNRVILIGLTLLGSLVVALSLYERWFIKLIVAITMAPSKGPAPSAAKIGEMAQGLSEHIVGLGLLGGGAVLASGALILMGFLSLRALSNRQILWGRALAAILLVAGLIAAVMAARQLPGLYETAITGAPSSE